MELDGTLSEYEKEPTVEHLDNIIDMMECLGEEVETVKAFRDRKLKREARRASRGRPKVRA
jgi:hypothetical protein